MYKKHSSLSFNHPGGQETGRKDQRKRGFVGFVVSLLNFLLMFVAFYFVSCCCVLVVFFVKTQKWVLPFPIDHASYAYASHCINDKFQHQIVKRACGFIFYDHDVTQIFHVSDGCQFLQGDSKAIPKCLPFRVVF